MLHDLNMSIFHAINGLAGNWTLDRIINYEEANSFLKGGIALAVYWYFWFDASPRQGKNRQNIIGAFVGSYVALIVNRCLSAALPFEVRPMYDAAAGYHPPILSFPINLEDWSSFPSDTATYFFALAFGVFALSRIASVALMLFSAIWVCLPRIYLGVHYPSDILVGALLGIGGVFLAQKMVGRRLAAPVLGMERAHPGFFYAGAFVLSYEMAVIFDDARNLLRAVARGLKKGGFIALGENAFLFSVGGALVVLGALLILVWRWRAASRSKLEELEATPPVT